VALDIGIVAHLRHPIAAPFMGGMEAHAWHLARGLQARGHRVALYAAGDSDARFDLRPLIARHYDRDYPWHDFHGTEVLNALLDRAFDGCTAALERAGHDVIHNNSLHRFPPRHAHAHGLPMLTSLHVPPFEGLRRAAQDSISPWSRFTVCSDQQAGMWWPDGMPEGATVVPNGIDLDLWPFVPTGNGEAVWAGRITPNKGAHLALEAARIAGVPLTLFGSIEHRDYFEDRVRPLLGEGRRYGGHLAGPALAQEMGRASALLFTPLWQEPFGLVAIEAMACGLPVAATRIGATADVIGPCGAYAEPDDAAGLARALHAALRVPRREARLRVERLFSLDVMLDRYEAQYRLAMAAAPVAVA